MAPHPQAAQPELSARQPQPTGAERAYPPAQPKVQRRPPLPYSELPVGLEYPQLRVRVERVEKEPLAQRQVEPLAQQEEELALSLELAQVGLPVQPLDQPLAQPLELLPLGLALWPPARPRNASLRARHTRRPRPPRVGSLFRAAGKLAE